MKTTSEAYAIAKIAGTKMCQAYKAQYGFNAIVAVPATLYGPGSDTDIETAHVLGALIAKFHKAKNEGAKEVIVWGSGKPVGNFYMWMILSAPALFLMENYDGAELINVGSGYDVTIKQLAGMIKKSAVLKAKLISMHPSLMAPCASSWTIPACANWAGSQRSVWKKEVMRERHISGMNVECQSSFGNSAETQSCTRFLIVQKIRFLR